MKKLSKILLILVITAITMATLMSCNNKKRLTSADDDDVISISYTSIVANISGTITDRDEVLAFIKLTNNTQVIKSGTATLSPITKPLDYHYSFKINTNDDDDFDDEDYQTYYILSDGSIFFTGNQLTADGSKIGGMIDQFVSYPLRKISTLSPTSVECYKNKSFGVLNPPISQYESLALSVEQKNVVVSTMAKTRLDAHTKLKFRDFNDAEFKYKIVIKTGTDTEITVCIFDASNFTLKINKGDKQGFDCVYNISDVTNILSTFSSPK